MCSDIHTHTLGTCPLCEQDIGPEWLLARYMRTDEPTMLLASCPSCRGVVEPRGG